MSTVHPSTLHHGFHADPETGVCYRALDFIGFPGYRVGDDGSVWSCKERYWTKGVRGCGVRIGTEWHQMELSVGAVSPFYKLATLSNVNGSCKYRHWFVHILVVVAFHSDKPSGLQCCHNNGIATDNYLSNLRWGTPKDNAEDMMKHGKHFKASGELNGEAKLDDDEIKEIRTRYNRGGVSQRALAEEYDISQAQICRIVNNQTWTHL